LGCLAVLLGALALWSSPVKNAGLTGSKLGGMDYFLGPDNYAARVVYENWVAGFGYRELEKQTSPRVPAPSIYTDARSMTAASAWLSFGQSRGLHRVTGSRFDVLLREGMYEASWDWSPSRARGLR